VNLAVIRQQITNLAGNAAVDVVEITMQEVGKGHYLGMKYLFEMIGLYPPTGEKMRRYQLRWLRFYFAAWAFPKRLRLNKQLRKIRKPRLLFQTERA
jgi:hypothetical protein